MGKKPDYGLGHPAFLEYTHFIADHPNYAGMPDLYTAKGHVQWEAPSNRKTGEHKDTYRRRLDWWRSKARQIGIDPNSSKWISKAAKSIHPTMKKPCKKCGRILDIRYVYPSKLLLDRLYKLGYGDEVGDPLTDILTLVTQFANRHGSSFFKDLPSILATGKINPPSLEPKLDVWIPWITSEYVPHEPSTLSPGAMSNAPDRLDGFHSFNICCRGSADTGRHTNNLKSYTTDRRAFEFWNEGDWIAADRLMGEVKASFSQEMCGCGRPGLCTADHIGPLSLGFAHRPEFQLLCGPCNSAKNNRMPFRDVAYLRGVERSGETITSWYNRALWDLRNNSVVDDETALRLSKLLRDNRHTAMNILYRVFNRGNIIFLVGYLGLEYADFDVKFANLRVADHLTRFDRIVHTPRTTRYAAEQKARRIRVAFDVLENYASKSSRNALLITNEKIEHELSSALEELDSTRLFNKLDQAFGEILRTKSGEEADIALRPMIGGLPQEELAVFKTARSKISAAVSLVAKELDKKWDDERYVRGTFEDEL